MLALWPRPPHSGHSPTMGASNNDLNRRAELAGSLQILTRSRKRPDDLGGLGLSGIGVIGGGCGKKGLMLPNRTRLGVSREGEALSVAYPNREH
jgi:hypothetical protein